jgi:hypothetical protein
MKGGWKPKSIQYSSVLLPQRHCPLHFPPPQKHPSSPIPRGEDHSSTPLKVVGSVERGRWQTGGASETSIKSIQGARRYVSPPPPSSRHDFTHITTQTKESSPSIPLQDAQGHELRCGPYGRPRGRRPPGVRLHVHVARRRLLVVYLLRGDPSRLLQ